MRSISIQTLLIFGVLVSSLALPDDDTETISTNDEPVSETTPAVETTPASTVPTAELTPASAISESGSPLSTAADGINSLLTTKTKFITQIPEAINNVTTDTIKEVALIPEKAKSIITDATKLSPAADITNKRLFFKSKIVSTDATNEKSVGVAAQESDHVTAASLTAVSIESVLADVKQQFQALNDMLASKQSTGSNDEINHTIHNELVQKVRENIMQLFNDTQAAEEEKKNFQLNQTSLNETQSSNFLTSITDYLQTQPQISSTVVFAVTFVVISVVSACVNCIFLLVFKLSRKLRKSLLGTFYTDLRRSFNPAENIPLYHNV